MKKYRDADRFEPVPCRRCGGSGLEPRLTDELAELAGPSHLADLGRQIANNPVARHHASAALAALVGGVPPDGEVGDVEAILRQGGEG